MKLLLKTIKTILKALFFSAGYILAKFFMFVNLIC